MDFIGLFLGLMSFFFPVNSAVTINFILRAKLKISAKIHTTLVHIKPYSIEIDDFFLSMNTN